MKLKQHTFIGRAADIPIYLHLSWPILLILGIGALALGPVEIVYGSWPPLLRWAVALGLGLLMALSVILHDAAHLAVAAARRLPVRQITLYPFGGLVQLRGVPIPAVPLVQMTLAGPLAGLAQTAFWLGVSWLLDITALYWVAQFNLALTLVNLLPTPPLDGGRLLWLIRGYFPNSNDDEAIVAFSASAVLGLATILPGGMALLSGVIQVDPAYILAGALLILTGILIQKTPAQTAIVCTTTQQTWLKQTTVAQFLGQPKQCRPAARQFPRLRFGPSFFSADTANPSGPATLLPTPTMAAWIVHPPDSLWDAIQKLDDAGAARLLVVADGSVVDHLTQNKIIKLLKEQKELNQPTPNSPPFNINFQTFVVLHAKDGVQVNS